MGWPKATSGTMFSHLISTTASGGNSQWFTLCGYSEAYCVTPCCYKEWRLIMSHRCVFLLKKKKKSLIDSVLSKAKCTLCDFFLSFANVACQTVRYEPGEILVRSQSKQCDINHLLCQTQDFGHNWQGWLGILHYQPCQILTLLKQVIVLMLMSVSAWWKSEFVGCSMSISLSDMSSIAVLQLVLHYMVRILQYVKIHYR